MAIKDFFKKDSKVKGFTIVDKVTIAYIIFTSMLLCYHGPEMEGFSNLVYTRMGALAIIGLLYGLRWVYPTKFSKLLSDVIVMLGLIFWYQDRKSVV